MSIAFRCPQCQRLLRVPSESAGAKARCPECGTIADVPRAATQGIGPDPHSAGLPPGQDANPFAEVWPSHSGSSAFGNVSENPYSAPASGYPAAGGFALPGAKPALSGEVVATPVEAGEVIAYAWEVWKANLGLLLGITVVVFAFTMGLSVVRSVVEAVLRQQGEEATATLVGLAISIFNNLLQMFLGIGQAQIVLKLLRGRPAEFGELFGGGPLFLRVLGAAILAGIVLVFGFMACIIPGIILAIFFWPFYYLIVDGKAGALESFGMASPLGQANIATTIVLWLASMGIIVLGLLALCVGVLFAAPLVSLMWGAAYLMMSGQLKALPRY